MNCIEAKRHLEPFLDGELSVEANLEVLRHLGLCTRCSSVFEGEKQLLDMVRRNCPASAPESLTGRITSALDREASPRSQPVTFRVLVPMAAAALIVSLVAWAISGEGRPRRMDTRSVAHLAVARHDLKAPPQDVETLPLCPNSCPTEAGGKLRQFFVSKGQDSCLHDLQGIGYSFVNASIDPRWLPGVVTCWTSQQEKESGRRVTHAMFKAPEGRFSEAGMNRIREDLSMGRVQVGEREVLVFYHKGFV